MPADGGVDDGVGPVRDAVGDSEVRLTGGARLELRAQCGLGLRGLRQQQHAARVLVQPVHDPGSLDIEGRREWAEALEHPQRDRGARVTGRTVDSQPRRLVDRQHHAVLVEDGDVDPGRKDRVDRRGHRDREQVASKHLTRLAHEFAVDGHVAGGDQPL